MAKNEDYVCKDCQKMYVVPSLARSCEEKHDAERRKNIKAA